MSGLGKMDPDNAMQTYLDVERIQNQDLIVCTAHRNTL